MLRDIVGRAEDEVEIEARSCLGCVFQRYARQFPRLGELKSSIVLARNHQFSDRSTVVGDGDEIAFLPPVSGGSGRYTQQIFDAEEGCFFALTREPIDTTAVSLQLLRG